MNKRKIAAFALSILAFITIFFTVILPCISSQGSQTLAFGKCKIHYKYSNGSPNDDVDRAENNKFALCLCNLYIQKPDTAIGNKILSIYHTYDKGGDRVSDSLGLDKNLDSIIKNRNRLLDTMVLID